MSLRLERIEAPAPCEAYVARVSGFPLPAEEAAAAGELWRNLTAGRASELFVQFAPLALGDGAARVMANAAKWRPEIGLGVWPDQPPPRGYTREDFENLGLDEQPRRLDYQVLRVAGPEARDTMLGSGALLEIVTPDGNQFLARARELLRTAIQDPTFASFPLYVPLLRAGPLQPEWLCGASLYLRESVEDRAILVVTTTGLPDRT